MTASRFKHRLRLVAAACALVIVGLGIWSLRDGNPKSPTRKRTANNTTADSTAAQPSVRSTYIRRMVRSRPVDEADAPRKQIAALARSGEGVENDGWNEREPQDRVESTIQQVNEWLAKGDRERDKHRAALALSAIGAEMWTDPVSKARYWSWRER